MLRSGGIGPESVCKSRRKITLFKAGRPKINQNLIPMANSVFVFTKADLIYLPTIAFPGTSKSRKQIYATHELPTLLPQLTIQKHDPTPSFLSVVPAFCKYCGDRPAEL
jgi:hypothetical protein